MRIHIKILEKNQSSHFPFPSLVKIIANRSVIHLIPPTVCSEDIPQGHRGPAVAIFSHQGVYLEKGLAPAAAFLANVFSPQYGSHALTHPWSPSRSFRSQWSATLKEVTRTQTLPSRHMPRMDSGQQFHRKSLKVYGKQPRLSFGFHSKTVTDEKE